MNMEIVRASAIDVPEISRLLEQVLCVHHSGRPDIFKANSKKYSENELFSLLNDDERPIFVAKNATRVLGYVFCIVKKTNNDNIFHDIKTLYIDDLCVDECVRGKRVGTALYEYVKRYARESGCYNVTLNVWECNHAAKRFYEKMGLLPQKTIMEEIL